MWIVAWNNGVGGEWFRTFQEKQEAIIWYNKIVESGNFHVWFAEIISCHQKNS